MTIDARKTLKYGCAVAALAAATLAFAAPAMAQDAAASERATDTIEDIVVTATRREANVQDIGIAVTAISGEQLTQMGVRDSTDLAAVTPGLQFTAPGGSPVAGLISIRGVSQNDFAGHIEPANAFYVDEVYQPSSASSVQQLYDLSRVEVLKGPQGTLFGRNATGGLIHVLTNQPSQEFGGFVDLTAGSFDQRRVEAAVGGPLSDTVSARLAVLKDEHDGYIRNSIGPDINNDDTIAGRLQVKITPSDALTINLFADIYKIRPVTAGGAMIVGAAPGPDGLGVLLPPGSPTGFGYADADGNPYTGAFDSPGRLQREAKSYGAKISYDIAGLTLSSITSVQEVEGEYAADNDYSPVEIGVFMQNGESRHITQELRLTEEDGAFRWTAGVYYLKIEGDYFQGFDLTGFASYPRADYSVDTESYSAFGQVEYDISDTLKFTGGLRITRDEKDYSYLETCDGPLCASFIAPGSLAANGLTTDNHDETGVSGRLALDWRPNDDTLLYASINRGYKAFNYNAGFVGQAPLSGFRFDGENLMAYEVGGKFDLLDGRVRFNAAAFYYDYADYQAFDQRGFNFTLFNTDAEIYGADMELTVRPGAGFQLKAGLALLDTNVSNVPIGGSLVDRIAPQSPDYTLDLSVSKNFAFEFGDLDMSINANYTDDSYAQLSNAPATLIPGDWLANARVSLTSVDGRYEVAVFVNNLFDEARETFAFDVSGPPLGGSYRTYALPRWVGVSVRTNF
ncbi:TonB-dependent receptor [Brevundimonas sp.]|uniref:TonB-dependent receptor n=1 Tax=Brevundimonas sp. TaxID=1871086 RepID=UPI003BADBA57